MVPDLFVKTGVSLPYLSLNTTPSWYSLSDFMDFLLEMSELVNDGTNLGEYTVSRRFCDSLTFLASKL